MSDTILLVWGRTISNCDSAPEICHLSIGWIAQISNRV